MYIKNSDLFFFYLDRPDMIFPVFSIGKKYGHTYGYTTQDQHENIIKTVLDVFELYVNIVHAIS